MKQYKKKLCAILSFIMMLMLGLCFCSCNNVDISNIHEWGESEMISFRGWGGGSLISSGHGCEITPYLDEEDAEFICSTEVGAVEGSLITHESVQEITVCSGERVYWRFPHPDDSVPPRVYVDIVVRKNVADREILIGYAVVGITKVGKYDYIAGVVKAVTFPKEDGKYQDITREQVDALIKQAKEL